MFRKDITTMIQEIELQSSCQSRASSLRQIYLPLQMPAWRKPETTARRILSDTLSMNSASWKYCDTSELRRRYESICKELNRRHPLAACRTAAEVKVMKLIRSHTKIQVIPSMWVGNVNLDLFIPAITIGTTIGLAIELDGRVHDRELKSRKDAHKISYLADIGIGVSVIENSDLSHPTVQAMLSKLKVMKRGCSRKRKLLWRRIYLETILCHSTRSELTELFGYSPITLEFNSQP